MKRRATIAFSALLFVGSTLEAAAGLVLYTYDQLGRIVRVDYGSGRGAAYFYDAAGNRVALALGNPETLPSEPPTTPPIAIISSGGVFVVVPIQ